MYFLFKTVIRDGIEFVSPKNVEFSENIIDGYYLLKCEDYPQYFFQEKTKDIYGTKMDTPLEWGHNLYEGWENYPLVIFNKEKYLAGKDPFEPFNPYNHEYFKKAVRRHKIEEEIAEEYVPSFELKRLRKVVRYLLQGEKPPKEVVNDFMKYNNKVESIIAKHPKTKEYFDKIDLIEYNGVKEKYDEKYQKKEWKTKNEHSET